MHPKALAHYQEGHAHRDRADLASARDAYLQALEHDARYAEARLALAEVLAQLGDLTGALTHARTLLDDQPNSLPGAYLLGVLLAREGRLGEAVGTFQRALFLDATFQPALRALIEIHRQQGDVASEIAMLERLAALDPKDAESRFALAERMVRAGRTADAAAPLRDALALEPNTIQGYLLLADIEGRMGRGDEAWKILQSVAGRAPQAPGLREALLSLCRSQASDAQLTNNAARASQWWERLLAIAPDDPEALSRLERLYTTQSRMGDLVRLLEGFSDRHPQDAAAVLRLADAMLAIGRKQDALAIYKQVLSTHPDEALRQKAIEVAIDLGLSHEAKSLTMLGRSLAELPAEERLKVGRAKVLEGQKEEAWSLFEGLFEDAEHGETAKSLARNMAVMKAEELGDNPVEALKWWERALSCNAQDETAARAAAILYRQIHRGADAVRVLRALPDRYKKMDLLRELAAACDAAEMYAEGHEAYTALMAREGETAEGLLHLIGLSLGAHKIQRAWSECERFGRLDPNHPKLKPTQAKVSAAIAEQHEQEGNYAEAVAWWNRHVTFDSDSPARKRLAAAQIAVGDLNGAVLSYRAWFRRHSTDIETALWLGNNELEEGLFSEAREYFEAVLELRPNNLEALHGLAKSAAGEGNDDEALRLFGRILALEKDHLPASLAMAQQASAKGDDAGAWELLKRVLAQNPDHKEAKGVALPILKRLAASTFDDVALGWWEQVLVLDPEDPDALKALAKTAARRATAPTEAAKAFAEVLKADPADIEARVFLAQQAFDGGQVEEAMRHLDTPGVLQHPLGGVLAGQIALREQDLERARALFEGVLATNPADPKALLGLAELALVEKNFREAWNQVRALPLELYETPRVRDLASKVARRLAETSTGPAAIPIFEELLKLEPRDVEARFALAEVYLDEQNEVQAALYLQQILAIDPTCERAALMLAELLSKGGQPDAALKALAPLMAAELPAAGVLAGRLHLRMGNRARARSEFERVLGYAPSDPQARMALAELSAEQADGPETWRHLKALLEGAPGDRAVRQTAYRLLRDLAGRLEVSEVLPWWEEVVALDPEDVDLQVTLAGLLRQQGDLPRAASVLEAVLERAPHHMGLASELGAYYQAEGHLEKARNAFGIAAQGGDPAALKALAQISRREGDLPQSAAWLTKALERLPDDPALWLELAETQFEAGMVRAARTAVERVQTFQPDHPRARALRALVLRGIARASAGEEALACWRLLSEADPEDVEAHREAMREALALGDEAVSRAALERIVRVDPSDGMSALTLGMHHHALGEAEAARPLLGRAAEQGFTEANWYLADLALKAGEVAAAREHLARYGARDLKAAELGAAIARAASDAEYAWETLAALADLKPGDEAVRTERLALAVDRMRGPEPAEAMRWIERTYSIGLRPNEVPGQAIAALGFHWQAQGKQDDARQAFLWAAEVQDPTAMTALARMARGEGDLAAAAGWLARAMAFLPSDEALPLELADVLMADGHLAEAYELLVSFLRGHDAHAAAKERLVACLRRMIQAATGSEALHWRRELTQLAPDDLEAWRALAALAAELGRQDVQDRAMQELVVRDPEDVSGAEALGLRWLSAGRGREARALLERAAQAGMARVYLAASEACAQSGDAEAAQHWLSAHLQQSPEAAGSPAVKRVRFAIALAAADPEAAWEALAELEPHLGPADAATLRMVRLSLAWAPLQAGSGEWLDRALALDPTDADLPGAAHTLLGHRALREGRPLDAKAAYATAASMDDAHAMVALACLLREEGSLAEALVWFQRAQRILGANAWFTIEHAEILAETGQLAAAAAMLDDLLEEEPAHARALALLADIVRSLAYEASGAEALAWWQKLAALLPDDDDALRHVVRLANELNRQTEVLQALEQLVESDPTDTASALALGEQRLAEGDYSGARHLLEQAAEAGLKQALLPLVDTCLNLGDHAGARRWIEVIEAQDPDEAAVWGMRRRLAHAEGDTEAEWLALSELAQRMGEPEVFHSAQLELCLAGASGERADDAMPWVARARELAPEDPRVWILQAECLERLARHDEAMAAYRKAFDLGERTAAVCQALLDEAAERNAHAEAFQWAMRLLEADAGHGEAKMRALAHARSQAELAGLTPEGASWWARVVELAPQDVGAMRHLMLALHGAGMGAEAAGWARKLLPLAAGDAEAFAVIAEHAAEQGDVAGAQKALAAILKARPDHALARLVMARLERRLGHLAQAREILNRLVEDQPDALLPRLELADLNLRQGQLEAAERELAAVLETHPGALGSPRARDLARTLALAAEERGRHAEALAWWKHLLKALPDEPEALRAAARLLRHLGRPEEALSSLFAMAKQQPEPEDLLAMAELLLANRRHVEAKAILQSLTREFDHLGAWRQLGDLALATGDLAEAVEVAEALLAKEAEGADDFARRVATAQARSLDPAETPAESRQAWLQVLGFAPHDAEARLGVARAEMSLGDLDGAIEHLEALLKEAPDWPDAKAILAECLLRTGEAERAEHLFREVLDEHPAHPVALMALARSAQSRGEFVMAGEYCQRVLAIGDSPEADRARLLAAYCARQLAEAARLRRDFDQAFLYADLLVAYQAPTFDLMRFQAELARDAGRQAIASSRYRRLLIAHPEALDEGIQLSRSYPSPDVARTALEELWATHRPLAAAHALATLESDQGDHEAAIQWWERALVQEPAHPVILRRLADLCRREDRHREACDYYRRLAEATGFEPALLKTWGSTALAGDHFDLAKVPYERLATDHGDLTAALTLANVFARLEDYRSSWDWALKVREAEENAEAEHLAQEAAYQLAESVADPAEAIAWRERYLAHVPEDVDAWIAQGRALADLERLAEAVEALAHARELSPASTEAGWQLGRVLLRQGDREGARQVFHSVLAEDPKHVDSRFALSEMAWEEGDIQGVWELGQELLKLDNKNPRAMELIGRCARLLAHEATEAGDWESAILYWELLLSFAADEVEALTNLGEAYVKAGRFAEAVGIHRELVRLKEGDPDVKFRHGEIAAMGGFWDEARVCFTELRDADPAHLATHQALAIVALGLDEPPIAAGHYRDALAIAPDDLLSLVGLGRLLMAEGELAEAWEPLKRAATLTEGEAEHAEYVALAKACAERLADMHASKQKWSEAIAFCGEIVQLDPDDMAARRRLADTFYQAGRKAEAIGVLSALLQADPGDREAAFLLGEIHRQSGDLEGARRIYHGILEQEPGHFDARLALAELAWDASELEPAWTHLQEALNARPNDEAALSLFRKLTLAFAERSSAEGDFPAAIQWWQLAWQQDRSDVELLRKMARAQVTVGHLSGAADTYAKILDADPKDLETAHILADIHRQRGDLRSAEGPLLRIVALDPRHVPSLRALMHLGRDRHNPPETLKRAYDLLDVEPQNTEALMMLAWAHEQMMERRAALEACADVIALQPQHAEAHYTMGRLARDLGDLDLAKKALTSAIYHAPKAAYYHAMGTVYLALGQQDEALAAFGQALVLDPDYAEAHADLGLGLMRVSQPDKAKPHLQRAFSLIPPDTERSLALQCALDLIG